MKFDQGFVSPYFATNQKTSKVEFDDAYVLLMEKKVSNLKALLPILEKARSESKPLLIIAEDYESEVLAALIINKMQGILRVCCVKSPSFGDNRKNIMVDLEVYTGGRYVNEEIGMSLENEQPESVLGRAKKVIVSKDDFVLMEGAGSKEAIKARVDVIEEQSKGSTSDYDREKMSERVSKLKGHVGSIRVGGGSEVEIGEAKDRINDALCATRAAIAEGIVAGGGSALIYASRGLAGLKTATEDQKNGVEIIERAVRVPLMTIVSNAGFHDQSVLKTVLDSKDERHGFDAAKGEFKDMIQGGIIDPVKVVRTALQDSVSVASMMMTTECIIHEEDKKEDKK
jgi:chaperonin GroEL